MLRTFAECTTHGRQPARQLPVTEYRMQGGRRVEYQVVRTWRSGDLAKCGHQAAGRFDCNAPSPATVVDAIVTEAACSEVCTSAVGRRCECSCGGENHGGAA